MVVITSKNGKLGVENIKRLFSILLSIYAQVKSLIQKFDVAKLIELGIEVIKYKDDLDIFKIAWDEIKDLEIDDGELREITEHLEIEAKRLKLSNENVLVTVKEAIALIGDIFELYENGKNVYEKSVVFIDRIRSLSIKESISVGK